MPYLQHSSRHLARTVTEHIRGRLATLGWLAAPAPLGATPFTVETRRLRESEVQAITSNTLGIFFGEESDDEPFELGGGNMRMETTFYCDIIAEKQGIGLAVASDIKDLLTGRVPGLARMITLRDYTTDPAGVPQDDYLIEFVQVSRARPENSETKLNWQILTCTLELVFPGEE